jgi:curved DNA-binding protein CbpA
MSFKIDSGLFLLDFTDRHAILGVPVDADFKEIRKRYLQIARLLHPDTCAAVSEADKQWANQLLSKLVNPAYEKFANERNRAEYMVMLKEMSKRLTQQAASIQLKNELSQQLKQSNNLDHAYRMLLHKLAQKQYQSFEQVLPAIAQISELNLVYLMRQGVGALQTPSPQSTAVISSGKDIKQPAPEPPEPESLIETYLRRAQALMENKNFAQARVELQDALKLAPNNSRCHSSIGEVYLKQNQTTMAKVHINKALQLNPQDPIALKIKQQLDQLAKPAGGKSTTPSKGTQSQSSNQSKSGGGLFGGLFGGKKK